ncbi:MAG: glycosyltransferase family 4 protein [Myxococcales bacterium]|nr:glycosyltransferase family 4 protein [Myxococcales bacterium]
MGPPEEKKTKILLSGFFTVPAPNGNSCWLAEEIRILSRHFDVDVLSLKTESLSHIERFFGARLLRVPTGGTLPESIKAFQRALNRQLDSEDYRVCHATGLWDGMVLSQRKKSLGYKLIIEPLSLPSVDLSTTSPRDARTIEGSYSLKQQEEKSLSLADRVLAGSGLLREQLVRRGILGRVIDLHPPWFDPALFAGSPSGPGQTGVVLYLGSLMPWQGVNTLLSAIARLPRQIPTRLLLVSPRESPWFEETMGKVQMLGLAKVVEHVPPVPFEELPKLLERAWVCVCPLGNHEHNRLAARVPHKVLVYLAARRAVVAAHQPALRGLMENGVHGLLYPPGDAGALAECLQKLLLDRELASQLGNQGRDRLERDWFPVYGPGRLLSLYRDLTGEPIPQQAPAPPGEDTLPRVPCKDQDAETPVSFTEAGSGDTAPLPPDRLAKMAHARPVAAEPAPPPPLPPETEGKEEEPELNFTSPDKEPPGPKASDADDWQVVEASQARIPDTAPNLRHGFLLGGPPFPIEGQQEAVAPEGIPTKRMEDGPVLPPEEGELEMVSEEDIQPLDGEPPRPASRPPRKRKTKG